MQKGLRKKRSIVFTWLVSYIIILAVPLFVSSFFYVEAEKIVQNEIKRANEFLLNQLQREMDNVIRTADVLYTGIGLNINIQRAAAISSVGAQTPDEKYAIYQAIQDLHKLNYYRLKAGRLGCG